MSPQQQKNKNFFSSDPNTAIQEMMSTIDLLRGIYARENEALEGADTQTFLGLQEEKLNAARNYQRGIEDFLNRNEEMRAVNPLVKKRLAQMQKDFSELASKNLEALSRMQRTTERLGDTIRSAARQAAQKQRTFSYGESGKIQTDNRRTVSMGVSETA